MISHMTVIWVGGTLTAIMTFDGVWNVLNEKVKEEEKHLTMYLITYSEMKAQKSKHNFKHT